MCTIISWQDTVIFVPVDSPDPDLILENHGPFSPSLLTILQRPGLTLSLFPDSTDDAQDKGKN